MVVGRFPEATHFAPLFFMTLETVLAVLLCKVTINEQLAYAHQVQISFSAHIGTDHGSTRAA